MLSRPHTLPLVFALHLGCTGICKGPACEDSYPAARLSVVRGLSPGETTLSDAEAGRWDGTEVEGSAWAARFAGSNVIIGQPDASRVVRVADRRDVGGVRASAEWTGAATELGASVAVVQAPDDPEVFDLWVGAPASSLSRGAIHLFRNAHLGTGGDESQADLTITSSTPSDRFGSSIIRCADLDGDRIPDLAVPAPQFAEPDGWGVDMQPLAGAVFLVLSSLPHEVDTETLWVNGRVYWGDTAGEGAGTAVACDRDLDDDGQIDVVIGAPWWDGTRGRLYVLQGSEAPSGPLADRASTIVDGPAAREWFGASLMTFSLVGQPALAVGAPGFSGGTGRVHLFPAGELVNAPPRPTAVFLPDPQHLYADHFGRVLARGRVLGNLVDGQVVPDPIEDLIIGTADYRDGSNGYDTGRLWVWSGADATAWFPGITADTADTVVTGSHPFERLGIRLHVGDPDGDGADDLLVPTRSTAPNGSG